MARHFHHRNPDGRFVHGCLDCKFAIVDEHPFAIFRCRCPHQPIATSPTKTLGKNPQTEKPPRRAKRFAFEIPPCAYLGPETGEPIKISCGGAHRRARECFCPDRLPVVTKRTGKVLPILAADSWWCNDLGPINAPGPRSVASCRTCPHRTPQRLLPAPSGD